MNAPRNELLRAIELALAGEWDTAHEVVQRYEADATAAWIHAVLHKIEGDSGNARYWYQRAGKLDHVALSRQSETAADDGPSVELAAIRAEIRAHLGN